MFCGSKVGVIGIVLLAGLSLVGICVGGDGEVERGESVSVRGKRPVESVEKTLRENHFVRVAQLRTQYLQALLRLEEKLTREERIDEALQIRAEVERFRRGNRLPETDKTRLVKLRELGLIYTNEVRRISSEFENEVTAYRKKRGEAFASKRLEVLGDPS